MYSVDLYVYRFTIQVLQLKNKEAEIRFLCYSFSDQTKTKQERAYFRLATITQDMRFRLSLIKYAEKHGVTKAALKYKTNRQYIYRRKNQYDGSWDSLRNRSRRPHSHPNQHTPEEIKLILDMRRRNLHAGLVVL